MTRLPRAYLAVVHLICSEAALLSLAALEHVAEKGTALPFRAREEHVELRKLLLLMFMDTHTTQGFTLTAILHRWV